MSVTFNLGWVLSDGIGRINTIALILYPKNRCFQKMTYNQFIVSFNFLIIGACDYMQLLECVSHC